MIVGLLSRLFARKAKEEMTPQEIMSEISNRLAVKGYFYDDQANSDLKKKMIAGMLDGSEGNVRPFKAIFRRPSQYRYIADRAILEMKDSAFGVKPTDKVSFVRENYYSDWAADKGDPWPSVTVLGEVTVADLLAEPHPAPVKNLGQRAVAAVREWFVN